MPALIAALRIEPAADVREALFTSLVLINSPASGEGLADMIRSDDAQLRTGALDALGAMPEITRALLPSLLSDADADVRLLSCELVRQLDASEAVDLLGPVLEQEMHPNVCGAAVDVLAELGDSLCVEPLRTCAARFASDPYLSFAIADAISRTSTRPASNG